MANEQTGITYALQRHAGSGEAYALAYDRDCVIVGVCGPLSRAEVDRLTANPGDETGLVACQYEEQDAEWAHLQEWSSPIAEC